ncbi:MAG: serine--tRNA ligase [Candidatus Curtissbacteria bacterium]|nr:serine--tRNA ligase [Candidatus Curtissbacteria bacterium]
MLDIKFIRENQKLVEEKSAQKGYSPNIKKLLEVDGSRRKLIEEVDKLRSDRKAAAGIRDEEKGTKIKSSLKIKEDELEKLNEEFYTLVREVPNLPKDDVPLGPDDKSDKVIKEAGKKSKFAFAPKDHLELGVGLDLIDVDRASKTSGARFGFIKNELVILELALVRLAFDLLTAEGFIAVIPPVIINKKIAEGLGYPEYETGEGYKLDDQFLVGTAEHSIVPMHMDETFGESDLPKRYVGFSTAFRREAGSYGKDTRGIFRVHQFDKVEMVSFVDPKDDDKEHQFLLSLEEKMVGQLGLPYRVVNKAAGELGFPTAQKYDIEIWIPSQKMYRETHSASTNTDFQSRRLNIKYQSKNQKGYVYILNATAFAIGRTLIAIMENYQQKDGSILVPKALQKYTGFSKIPR